MISKVSQTPPGRIFSAFLLFLGWSAQIIPLSAFTADANWKFETLRNESSEWWQTLTIQTVPGVVYHLQKSNSLDSGDWTNIQTTYGTGGDWACPIFPGSAPVVVPPAETRTLPAPSTNPVRLVFLTLEKTSTGGTLISWPSLDDNTMRRELLPGVTLDPVWDEFDASYANSHGNYLFGISSRLGSPVTFTSGAAALGPLDTAMVAAFTAALPTITANIGNSVTNAAIYTPQPENSGSRAFYRFAADWSVDSDGDGRFDWQELVLDGNNPFAADSDGDGAPDQPVTRSAAGGSGGGDDDYPTPMDPELATPLAHIEQQIMEGTRRVGKTPDNDETDPYMFFRDGENINGEWFVHSSDPFLQALAGGGTFSAFVAALHEIPFRTSFWSESLTEIYSRNEMSGSDGEDYTKEYSADRARFRLKLDAPAPAGGYRIPMRLATILVSHPLNSNESAITGQATQRDIMLEVAEGETVGTPVEVNAPIVGENQLAVVISACVTTRNATENISDGTGPGEVTKNGVCVTGDASFVVDFGTSVRDISLGANIPSLKIHWYKRKLMGDGKFERKLKGDGTYEEWAQMYDPFAMPASELISLEGSNKVLRGEYPGVYQLEARLTLPNGQEIEFPFLRMRNARSIIESRGFTNSLLVAGKPDYFGVCLNDTSKAVRDAAIVWLGDTGYSEAMQVLTEPGNFMNPSTIGSPKCNLFVTHIANSVGASTPYFVRKKWGIPTGIPSAPIAKDDWFTNPEGNIDIDGPGWYFLANGSFPTTDPAVADVSGSLSSRRSWSGGPCPGMTIASDHTAISTNHGHVGIVDYDGSWINAGAKKVTKALHLLDESSEYKPNTFRSR